MNTQETTNNSPRNPNLSWINSTPPSAAPAPPAFFPSAWISPPTVPLFFSFPNSPVKINLRPPNSTISRTKRQVASETLVQQSHEWKPGGPGFTGRERRDLFGGRSFSSDIRRLDNLGFSP